MNTVVRPRSFAMLVLILILAAAVYGFANTNTVPASYAGDGATTISGYVVSGLTYSIVGDGDPTDIDGLSFTLDANAGLVYVSFDGGTTWVDCSPSPAGTSISCTGLSQSVTGATQLRIVASD